MEKKIYILWDTSHIWGLMALHCVQGMGVASRLVNAQDIVCGLLAQEPPALLLVPGGAASLKYAALGERGCAAIREYVAQGGQYMGFCGGAGFGLSHGQGLGLCPWERGKYSQRLQHLVSGHVLSRLSVHDYVPACGVYSLPVWWPGFFAMQENPDVCVLATYEQPDKDLCLADIELSSLPDSTVQHWQDLYGVNMGADFLRGQPCVLTGRYGDGNYLLSYAHLETPQSPEANAWLAFLWERMAGLICTQHRVPQWDLDTLPVLWPRTPETQALHDLQCGLRRILALGVQHHLLFKRTPWLHGWRTGIPGGALNNIYTSICTVLAKPMCDDARAFWDTYRQLFAEHTSYFLQGVESYLLAERLATTLAAPLPDVMDRKFFHAQREQLFGKPMVAGGLCKELLDITDELVFLQS